MGVLVGVLCLLVGVFCLYAPRSQWARARYEAKYGEDVDEEQARIVRTFRLFGIAWLITGVLYLATTL